MITVNNISKSFGTTRAVDDLSFSIKEGEIVGLLGPNGAGKTTTMRILTGFLSPDTGSVMINDIPVIEKPILAQREIGYLPENNPLYKDMLVSEFLELSAELKHLDAEQKKDALDFVIPRVGLTDIYYRPIAELSKGYKQRVGIAQALLHRPKILIMDEPTEGLDPNQRAEIRSFIKELAKEHTIVISTHVMQEVEAVCKRIVIINKGTLVADGTPQELTRTSKREKTLTLELEGENISSELKKLKEVTSFKAMKSGKRTRVTLLSKQSIHLQPELSRVAHKNKWIIWELSEEKRQLEDIFHALTKEA